MDRRRVAALGFSLLLVGSVLALPAGANTAIIGEPELSVSSPTGPLQASQATTLTVAVTNEGSLEQGDPRNPQYEQQVTSARNARVTVRDGGVPLDVNTGTQTLGTLPTGQSVPLEFAVEVGNATPGQYEVPVTVEYTYTRAVIFNELEQPEFATTTDRLRTTVTVRVEARPQFRVRASETDGLFAGDTDRLSLTVENVGSRTATDARVALAAGSPSLFFGPMSSPQRSTSTFVGRLAPGESREVGVRVGATNDAAPGSYPVEATVSYENRNGVTERADPATVGVRVAEERRFALQNVSTERFRVDEGEARVRAEVVNTGSGTARQAAVRMQGGTDSPVTPTNGQSAVGDLGPGESAPVNFTVAVAADAEPGTNSFAFVVEYENAAGDVLTAPPVRQSLTIEPQQAPFAVENVSTKLTPGGSAQLDVTLRYRGDAPVSAVNARLFPTDPLSSADDGAFLGRLTPGDTATATFTVSAGGSAVPKTYDSSVEVRYDEPDGDTRFTDGMPVGVTVSESSGGLPLLPLGVVALLVVGAGGYALLRRR